MTREFEFEIDTEKVEKALGKLGGPKTAKIMRTALNSIGFEHSNWMKQRRFVPYSGRSPRNRLQVRSGRLRNSISHKLKGNTLRDLAVRMFVGSAYGHIHETGGDIKPKRGRFLTIPTKYALTKSGSLSGRFRIRKTADGYETDAGRTFLFKSKGGNLLIGVINRRTGKALSTGRGGGKELRAIYILRRSVHISPRLGFKAEFNKHTKRYIVRRIGQAGDEMTKMAVEA